MKKHHLVMFTIGIDVIATDVTGTLQEYTAQSQSGYFLVSESVTL